MTVFQKGPQRLLNQLTNAFLSEASRKKAELIIIIIAVLSFFIHLVLIGLVDFDLLRLGTPSKLLTSPIAAIYTPFSFILVYEVYLLIYYLPRSITVYIGKQYEIITLIVIRRIFKDLSTLELTPAWFAVKGDLVFTADLCATPVLFFLILVFYSLNRTREKLRGGENDLSQGTNHFIKLKNSIAVLMIPTFFGVALFSLIRWLSNAFSQVRSGSPEPNLNAVFFDRFFTILILADVLLLLISFLRTDRFSKVVRNSGFVISTVLIKMSFGAEGLPSTLLVVGAVLFGLTILAISNRFDRLDSPVGIDGVQEKDPDVPGSSRM
ncbi:MAG: hypothetical protein EBX52_11895 [Proteobacteria bacterium]|nr:hypothetical protein [Pseudomonadota bacterium]